jgi:hypothetical protein
MYELIKDLLNVPGRSKEELEKILTQKKVLSSCDSNVVG